MHSSIHTPCTHYLTVSVAGLELRRVLPETQAAWSPGIERAASADACWGGKSVSDYIREHTCTNTCKFLCVSEWVYGYASLYTCSQGTGLPFIANTNTWIFALVWWSWCCWLSDICAVFKRNMKWECTESVLGLSRKPWQSNIVRQLRWSNGHSELVVSVLCRVSKTSWIRLRYDILVASNQSWVGDMDVALFEWLGRRGDPYRLFREDSSSHFRCPKPPWDWLMGVCFCFQTQWR